MNIILLGAPGSGKGTQAERIAKRFKMYYLQTGEIARGLARSDKRIKEIIESGKLIPEQEMTMYVLDFLNKNKGDFENILFEGFPRFISQYQALENFLKLKGDDIDLAISLDITEEEAVKRISSRRICVKCGEIYNLVTNPPEGKGCKCGGELVQREDDKPRAVKVRFEYYKNNTKELIDYLDRSGKLVRIDGARSIEVIFKDIEEEIKKL